MKTTIEFKPAVDSTRRHDARMLVLDHPHHRITHESVADLARYFQAGDVFVVNDAATIPASFVGTHIGSKRQIELRLAANLSPKRGDLSQWLAIVFGEGDWRTSTEERPEPPPMSRGDTLRFSNQLNAIIEYVSPAFNRLVRIVFDGSGDALWKMIYGAGRPIQYSYLNSNLAPWDQQTVFSGPPIAVEPPSSGFHISWQLVIELMNRGVRVAPLTHATGISTTGDSGLDTHLPFPERSFIPPTTAIEVNQAKQRGDRIIALGTGVTRALESSVNPTTGHVTQGAFVSLHRLHPHSTRMVVDGIITGLHEPDSSHVQLLGCFIPNTFLETGYQQAFELGYHGHEYGDICLILTS